MKVISVCNPQFGVGKTTLSLSLGLGLYELNYSVLFIDIDPKGILSSSLNKIKCNINKIFSSPPNLVYENLIGGGEISIVSSNFQLAKAEAEVHSLNLQSLKDSILATEKEWDFVVVDTPSSYGLFTQNALVASDYILIPCTPTIDTPLALKDFLMFVERFINDGLNIDLRILGIVINKVVSVSQSFHSINLLEENFKRFLFKTRLPHSFELEAVLFSNEIFHHIQNNELDFVLKKFVGETLSRINLVS